MKQRTINQFLGPARVGHRKCRLFSVGVVGVWALAVLACPGHASPQSNAGEGRASERGVGSDERLPMFDDPALVEPQRRTTLDPRCVPLWIAALERPESDLRAEAADAIAQAYRQGVALHPMLEEAIPALLRVVKSDPNPLVQLSAIDALGELDDRSAATELLVVAGSPQASIQTILAVDTILAEWNIPQARGLWIDRLRSRDCPDPIVCSALRSLAAVRSTEAVPEARTIVADATRHAPVRVEAGRTLGVTASADLLDLASELAARQQPIETLLALMSLAGHQGPEVAAFARLHVADPDASVRAAALGLLGRINPGSVVADVASAAEDKDDQARLEAVRAFAAVATERCVPTLAKSMDDLSLPVRLAAGTALARIASGADAPAAASASRALLAALATDHWRVLERAALAAGEANLRDAAKPLIGLLAADRPEVRLAAATALRQLGAPDTMPALLDRARTLTAEAASAAADAKRYESIGRETTQVFMALGRERYQPADELLIRYIPKRSGFHPSARGAAIYALGKINEGRERADLVAELEARVSDNNPVDPEASEVRRFAAIALGRIGSRASLPLLGEFLESENSTVSVGGACRWAIMHIEGKELPALRPIVVPAGPFFLEPIE